ncbi:MAG: hypothetical protein DCC43_15870 [Candidatus Brocadia sp.]|nr:hypothetical protein [Candidatus Brocadia sp.]MCE7913025.1 hypothetical protein [Candidatus Brocadia sp. AMX3]MDG5997511.1 hypothetical protein [Candidatus Brocadia sp.]RIJ88719.1 MAG: hypothetical protein DCC43_15870 [Candidatus Brocadia sp.]UJS22132.1 MAG: hypothetical protein L3J18_07430 [Candidatus Brocadia sp.]
MNKIEQLLHSGDMRTKGKAEEVVVPVLSRPRLFDNVISAILTDNPGIRMRASDAAEKISRIHPAWLRPYKRLSIETIAKINQQEVRWHTAQILPRLKLNKNERQRVIALLKMYLLDKSRIVKTFAMQALTEIAIQDNGYVEGVRNLLDKLTEEGSLAMKARGRKLLFLLKKTKPSVTLQSRQYPHGQLRGINPRATISH